MKLLNYTVTLLLFVFIGATQAQAQYGFEWININQQYYKFKIGQEGIYRIDHNSLSNAGIPVGTINPKNFQLFKNGVEVPIYIEGEGDNTFDGGDFIEFHGTRNDGALDNVMYRTTGEQAHKHQSLANDTAIYFLTWNSSTSNARLSGYQNTNFSGKTADEWIWYKSAQWFKDEYYDGSPFANPGYFSEYTEGEGWFSPYIARNIRRTFKLPSSFYNFSGPTPEYEFILYGKADPTNPGDIVDGYNHETTIDIKNKIIHAEKFRGYKKIHHRDTLSINDIGTSTTDFRFTSSYLAKARQAVSYIELEYPRFLNMGNTSLFSWNYTGNNDYFKFEGYAADKSQPLIYDLANNTRILGTLSGQNLEFIRPNTAEGQIYITDITNTITVNYLSPVNFLNLDPSSSSYNYLIVTHPILDSSAQVYSDYRESTAGGSYTVQTVFTPDLYDLFFYGYHHPMAIRRFLKYTYNLQSIKPEYVLFLGKGQTVDIIATNPIKRDLIDLVPTWGLPPSDYPFVSEFTANQLQPFIAIGRIPALNNNDVIHYLDKVKLHEQYGNTSKTLLQLTGGSDANESATLRAYQEGYYQIAKAEKFGADRIAKFKDEAVSVTTSLVEEIQKEINNGVHVIGYFGHGAAQVLEVDIGRADQLNNKGKYPLFLFQGCALGHSFNATSLPEYFLLEPDNGGIAWIASSAYGFVNELNQWALVFYQNLYHDNYGESVGKLIQQTTMEFQNPVNHYNRAQCRQMTYHGDPAIKLFAPDKPDYETVGVINVTPEEVTAESDSFGLVLDIRNHGKALKTDTPNVFIQVKYTNDSIRKFGPYPLEPVYSNKEFTIWLPNNAWSAGLNKFTIMLDSGNYIDELAPLGEFNNVRTFDFYMPSNSIYCLSPTKDEIVSKTEAHLIAQNFNLLSGDQNYTFEIDTTPLFNSPLKQVSPVVIGNNLVEYTFNLPPYDSLDYFWRVRIDDPDAKWSTSTFAFIYGSEKGWSQGFFDKFDETSKEYIELDKNARTYKFSRGASTTNIIYASGAQEDVTTRRIFIDGVDMYPGFLYTGVGAVAIEPNTLDRYMDSSAYNKVIGANNWGINRKYYWPGTKSGSYWYNTNLQADRDSLVKYLNDIPEGYHLFLFTSGYAGNQLWEDTLYKSLEMFGASEIRSVGNGHPYGLYGIKGMAYGQGTEVIANYSSPVNPLNQLDEFATLLYPVSTEGALETQKVGPASSWSNFYRTIKAFDTENEYIGFDIYGVRSDNSDSLLFEDVTTSTLNLLTVSAEEFPYIKVKALYQDMEKRTPAHIDRWTLLYTGVPEGTLDPEINYAQSADTLQEGDSISVGFAYKNISELSMDSVLVLAYAQNELGKRDTIEYSYYPPLNPAEHFLMNYTIPTLGMSANNRIVISVNHEMQQLEQTLSNNVHSFKFHVLQDNRNPLLDVVFDGTHIMDYDIVPVNPTITMTVLDENKYIFIDDANSFDVTLTYPDKTEVKIVSSMSEVSFTPATKPGEKAVLELKAQDLPSGTYKLNVKVMDGSGNQSSEMAYEIHFVVEREATITNVYPYPNPFTTNMKFVFTLTGEQLPDYMKIQIMTISGKVVREINQAELGALKIGNNITEFSWDGTDQFGDQLANGVYLYKVTAKLNGEDVLHRESAGDVFFNDGYGKIYLMR